MSRGHAYYQLYKNAPIKVEYIILKGQCVKNIYAKGNALEFTTFSFVVICYLYWFLNVTFYFMFMRFHPKFWLHLLLFSFMFQVSKILQILVGWSWLVDFHSRDLGWLVVDKFLHKQGNKDVPAGTELLSSPLLNMIFINPLSTHTCQPTGENVLTLSPRDENGEKLSEGTPELDAMRIRGMVVLVVVA